MALVYTDPKNYQDIAKSIRDGLGSDITMKPNEMSSNIDRISLYKKHYNELLENFRDILIPDNATFISSYMFKDHDYLSAINIPETLTRIRISAFENCSRLRTIVLQNVVTLEEDYAFKNCNNLSLVIFGARPSSLSSTTFEGCNKLKDIYVPWSLNQVSGAPWGAINATLHYSVKYKNLFSAFYVNNIRYEFPIGMTWREFIESEYNIDNSFSIDMTESAVTKYSVKLNNKRMKYDSYTTATYADEAIISLKHYSTVS